jgi:uncharacterized protein (DUF2461 family)
MSWLRDASAFFAALELENTREHWQAHRAPYDAELRPAFVQLVEAVPGWGPWRVYRPHNDTRFGGAPYKTFLGAVTERADGVGAFVQVGPRGLLLGTGIPCRPRTSSRDCARRWPTTGPARASSRRSSRSPARAPACTAVGTSRSRGSLAVARRTRRGRPGCGGRGSR